MAKYRLRRLAFKDLQFLSKIRAPWSEVFVTMPLFILGLNHRTAPVSLRERVSFGPEIVRTAVDELRQQPGIQEACILSTCNRTELYCAVEDGAQGRLRDWLQAHRHLQANELAGRLYQHQDDEAVRHLMRVASGLDSLVLGEPQILGQLKQAVELGREQGSIKSLLGRLFDRGFSVAKRVRTETGIGASGVSVAYVAVSLARQIFADLSQIRVLLIGAGETIELAGRHLHGQGVQHMTVANRTLQRAQGLAGEWGADVVTLDEIPQVLPNVDIVVSSTASPLPLLGKGLMERVLRQRRYRPMLLIDLAVPRDIEAEVGELADAFLYTVDDLQDIVAENQSSREQAARQAELLIGEECQQFMRWYQALPTQESIRSYRQQAEQWQQEALQRAHQQLAQGAGVEQVLDELAHRLTNKLTHAPTEALRQAGESGDRETLALLQRSLGLALR